MEDTVEWILTVFQVINAKSAVSTTVNAYQTSQLIQNCQIAYLIGVKSVPLVHNVAIRAHTATVKVTVSVSNQRKIRALVLTRMDLLLSYLRVLRIQVLLYLLQLKVRFIILL